MLASRGPPECKGKWAHLVNLVPTERMVSLDQMDFLDLRVTRAGPDPRVCLVNKEKMDHVEILVKRALLETLVQLVRPVPLAIAGNEVRRGPVEILVSQALKDPLAEMALVDHLVRWGLLVPQVLLAHLPSRCP